MTIINYISIIAANLLVVLAVTFYIMVRTVNNHKWSYLLWDFFTVVDLIIFIWVMRFMITTGNMSINMALDLFFIGMYFPLAIGIINDDQHIRQSFYLTLVVQSVMINLY